MSSVAASVTVENGDDMASESTRLSQVHPAWTRPGDIYHAMGDALLDVAPERRVKGGRPPSPENVRPKIPPNVFYDGSRYYYDAPPEPQAPRCTCNTVCTAKEPNLASFKCHSCVKFDAKGKGWFCIACFNKHHPWYREEHHYVPIAEDDDMEYDVVSQNYRAELDRTLNGIQTLIKKMKDAQTVCREIDEDYRPDDMLKENAKRIEKSTQRVWELKHFVRGQLLSQNHDQIVSDLEYDDEKKNLLSIIPYKTRGGLTPYAKKLHGEDARVQKRRQRKQEKVMTDEEAAIILQTGARVMLARNRMLAKVSTNYQKVWNWKYMRYYFVNLRKNNESQWTHPPCISRHNEAVVLTPRSYFTLHNIEGCADKEWLNSEKRKEKDARRKAEKREKRRRNLLEAENEFKAKQDLPEGHEESDLVSLDFSGQPVVLHPLGEGSPIARQQFDDDSSLASSADMSMIAVGGGGAAIAGLRRRRAVEGQRQNNAMKDRVQVLNRRAAAQRLAEENLVRKGGLTRDLASKRLQSACRIWLARRELAARAEGLWVHVRPEQNKLQTKSGKRPRAYWFNFRTKETVWVKPKAFGTSQIREITTTECKKRLKKWWMRGNKRIVNMNLTYPPSHEALYNLAARLIQGIGRMYISRQIARDLTWETWDEEEDLDTGEPFWRKISGSGVVEGGEELFKWERPWTPRDSLVRIRAETKEARERALEQASAAITK